MRIFKIYGETLDCRDFSIIREDSSMFICNDDITWKTIIKKFNYSCERANAIGYYGNYDWFVEIREMKESQSHELYPSQLILRMDKEQYQKYKNISQYPIRPVFTTYKNFDCYEIRIYQNNVDYDLYFDSNGICPRFEYECDAWKYIFQNDLIK